MKKAFITGINGQDGSYLSEYLLGLGYEVHGTVRRNSTSENQSARLKPAFKKKEMTTTMHRQLSSASHALPGLSGDQTHCTVQKQRKL